MPRRSAEPWPRTTPPTTPAPSPAAAPAGSSPTPRPPPARRPFRTASASELTRPGGSVNQEARGPEVSGPRASSFRADQRQLQPRPSQKPIWPVCAHFMSQALWEQPRKPAFARAGAATACAAPKPSVAATPAANRVRRRSVVRIGSSIVRVDPSENSAGAAPHDSRLRAMVRLLDRLGEAGDAQHQDDAGHHREDGGFLPEVGHGGALQQDAAQHP